MFLEFFIRALSEGLEVIWLKRTSPSTAKLPPVETVQNFEWRKNTSSAIVRIPH